MCVERSVEERHYTRHMCEANTHTHRHISMLMMTQVLLKGGAT